jgi:hydroxymethylpyrimidine/phosphomethylpyrimidine kinase
MGGMKLKENCAVLTIAGSDSGGGAGIQADLKTFSALGVFGASAITAITAQNLGGVTAIQPVEPDVVRKQVTAVLEGFPVKAVKIGMLFSMPIIRAVADVLEMSSYRDIPIVLDPVFAATSGSQLIQDEAVAQLKGELFPMATVVTPNIPEAEILTGMTLETGTDMERAAKSLYDTFGIAILMKGGHLPDRAIDILCDWEGLKVYESKFITGVNNHGSGCTLSAAIAAAIARGETLRQAIQTAKDFIQTALKQNLALSDGLKVINHFAQC